MVDKNDAAQYRVIFFALLKVGLGKSAGLLKALC
jgi:hypothetical protein